MYNLYFENSKKERRVIAEVETKEDVWKEITKFLDEHNFKSYYSRLFKTHNNEWCIDVGSHTEFFYVSSDLNIAG